MKKYWLTFKILSDTCFGSGISKNGLVQNEILVDENGFPYFHGKTFKGILKEHIENIFMPSANEEERSCFERWFNQGEKKQQNSGTLSISNFYLDEAIVKVLDSMLKKRNDAHPNETKDALKRVRKESITKIKCNTKISLEGKTAEDQMLRRTRVIQKGFVFNGHITLWAKEENEVDLLKECIGSIQHVGLNKNRGQGRVQCSLAEDKDKSVKLNYEQNGKVMLYHVVLKEPIKVSSDNIQSDYEETKTHIPAATMRGAFIGAWIKAYGPSNEKIDKMVRELRFSDLYPMAKVLDLPKIDSIKDENHKRVKLVETDNPNENSVVRIRQKNHYGFPTPNYFRAPKYEAQTKAVLMKDDFISIFPKKSACKEKDACKKDLYTAQIPTSDFCYFESNALHPIQVKTTYKIHHSKQMQEENIYRYCAIEKGQHFYGVIDFSGYDDKTCYLMMDWFVKQGDFQLGGSRNSGYGGVSLTQVKTFDSEKTLVNHIYGESNKNGVVYFLSDVPVNQNLEEDIFSSDNQAASTTQLSLRAYTKTGFNHKWRCRTPIKKFIEKGSVLTSHNAQRFTETMKDPEGNSRALVGPVFLEPNIIYNGHEKKYYQKKENEIFVCYGQEEMPAANGQEKMPEHEVKVQYVYIEKEENNSAYHCSGGVEQEDLHKIKRTYEEGIVDQEMVSWISKIVVDTDFDVSLFNQKKRQGHFIIDAIDFYLAYGSKELMKNCLENFKKTSENQSKNRAHQEILDKKIPLGPDLKDITINDFLEAITSEDKMKKENLAKQVLEDKISILKAQFGEEINDERIICKFLREILYHMVMIGEV